MFFQGTQTKPIRNLIHTKSCFDIFRAFRFLTQKSLLQKSPFFVSSEIAKGGAKLLTFVKTARNADLEIAEK